MKTIFKSLVCFTLFLIPYVVNSAAVLNTDNGHYYEVFFGTYTWDSANAEAGSRNHEGLQGHLATVTSATENFWIVENLDDYQGNFIGGTDSNTEGVWEWVTGETFSYDNFLPGEPNSWNSLNEDYLMYWWSNGWNDTTNDPYSDVGFELGYIVEYENTINPSAVPIPTAVWLFASGFLGVISLIKRKQRSI